MGSTRGERGGARAPSGTGATIATGARLENNLILGSAGTAYCGSGAHQIGFGLSAAGDVDVSSNRVTAMRLCPASLASYQTPPTALYITGSGGTFRNNILSPGVCGNAAGEATSAADPLVFEHNALSPATYNDEGRTLLTSVASIEALQDMSASGNLASDCAPVSNDHLELGSPCINAGTLAGAPWRDRDGDVRDALPDIGVDEYKP